MKFLGKFINSGQRIIGWVGTRKNHNKNIDVCYILILIKILNLAEILLILIFYRNSSEIYRIYMNKLLNHN